MKTILIVLSILLSACQTLPVQVKYPELPSELTTECADLKTIEGNITTLSKLMDTVAKNYSLYHECSAQNSAIIEWHRKQMTLFNKKN